jgi:hypothetical protein
MAGIRMCDELKSQYNKWMKHDCKSKFFLMRIQDKAPYEVVKCAMGSEDQSCEEAFEAGMAHKAKKPQKGRICLFKVEPRGSAGHTEIVMVGYCGTKPEQKMKYPTTYGMVKDGLGGIKVKHEIDNINAISYADLVDSVSK